MILPDVNVLVYAHREDAADHPAYRDWLESVINSDSAFGLSDLVVGGFIRIVTHPRIFRQPSSLVEATQFASELRDRPNRVAIEPGPHHWRIFQRLCREANVKGNLVPDAYLAAMAMESGCEWNTSDGDFARFRSLKWRHPLRS